MLVAKAKVNLALLTDEISSYGNYECKPSAQIWKFGHCKLNYSNYIIIIIIGKSMNFNRALKTET